MKLSAKSVYIMMSLALIVPGVLYALTQPWTIYADVWEQIAAMQEFARHPTDPLNPLLQLPGETSVRFTPYTLFWGILTRFFGWSTTGLLAIVSTVNLLLIVTGIWRLSASYSENRWLPPVWLAMMLWMWGSGYAQSNAYQLGTILYTAPYIAIFTYGLGFHALASLSEFLKTGRKTSIAVYSALTVLAFLSHPITAAFVIVAAGAMALPTKSFKLIDGLQIVPLLCVLAALAWPYFNYWQVLTDGLTEPWFTPKNESLISILGPSLAGFLVVALFVRKRVHPFVSFGVLFCAIIYIVTYLLKIHIGGRFVLFEAIFLHLALALYIVEQGPELLHGLRNRRVPAILTAAALVLLVLWGARYRQREVREVTGETAHWIRSGFSEHGADIQSLEFLENKLAPTDIVLAPSKFGLILPVLTGAKVVSHIHGSPLIHDELSERCEIVDTYYTLSDLEARKKILEKYSATYVLIEKQSETWPLALRSGLPAIEAPVTEDRQYALYSVPRK